MTLTRAKASPPGHLVFHDVGVGAPDRARRWVGTFSGDLVSIQQIDIPPTIRGAERLKAAEIQLSERVAAAPANLMFLPLPASRSDRAWAHVIVVDRSTLDGLRDNCPLGCLALLPDFLALPFADGCAVLEAGGSDALIRLRIGADFGCTTEAPILAEVLQTLAEADAIDTLWIGPGVPPEFAQRIRSLGLAPVSSSDLSEPDDALVRAQDMGVRFASSVDDLGPWLRRHRIPISALYATLALASAGLLVRAGDVSAEAEAQRAQATAIARATFLPNGPILDLRQQVDQALAAAKSAGAGHGRADFTSGLARMSKRLASETDAVSRIAWGTRDGYVIDLTTDSFADLQALETDLTAAGFEVMVAASRVLDEGRVGATLRLALSGGAN